MKTKLFTLLLLCVSNFVIAQESNHLIFKNIPIDGAISTFTSKLKSQGYETGTIKGTVSGEFAGNDCYIAIYDTDHSHKTYQVIVVYDTDGDSWYSIKSEYNRLKELYKSKYGKPTTNVENFTSPYYEGDGYETSAIRLGKCFYVSEWEFDNGKISILIAEDNILIAYVDKTNNALNEQEQRNKSINDI